MSKRLERAHLQMRDFHKTLKGRRPGERDGWIARRRKKAVSTHPGEWGNRNQREGERARPAGFLQGIGIADFGMAKGR